MKVFQPVTDFTLPSIVKEKLDNYRLRRNFSASLYVQAKANLINKYLTKSKLSGVVVALSGGIDSAVVLSIVNYAKNLPNSPIRVIIPAMLPAYNNVGVSNQNDATVKAIDFCRSLNLKPYIIDVEHSTNAIQHSVESVFNMLNTGSDWAIGQLVPYTRTPTLYYIATLLSDNGYPSLIAGTTNRDEGSYLGYVGKASDGMVDLQIISDIHKSEVYEVAKFLKVSDAIINAIPRGDMFDNKSDVDIFGASYDFVEYYTTTDRLLSESQFLNEIEYEKYKAFCNNLENLHNYNKHKYFAGSPAVHLNILESGVKNGWKLDYSNEYYNYLNKQRNDVYGNFVGKIDNQKVSSILDDLANAAKDSIFTPIGASTEYNNVVVINNIISNEECNTLLQIYENNVNDKVQANVYGYRDELKTNHSGSDRLTLYSVELSELIYKRILPYIPQIISGDTHKNLTVDDCSVLYKSVGVNPSFRYIAYGSGGMLVPHYDYPFKDNVYDGITLYTVVLYLTSNTTGATRFFKDCNADIPWQDRDISDMSYEDSMTFNKNLTEDDILVYNVPVGCSIAIFPHGMLHDCSEVIGEQKIIMRTDVMYKQIKFS